MGKLEEGQILVGEDWRRDVNAALEEHTNRFIAGNVRFERTERRLEEVAEMVEKNTAITQRIEANTAELLGIFTAVQGFVKVGGWMGKAVLWVGAILLAMGIIYWWWKTGDLPKKP